MKKLIALSLLAAPLMGCTDAGQAKLFSLGNKFKIVMYSGGKPVKEWTSTGKVLSEASGSGYYFMDSATGKLVRVNGDVAIERID